MSAGGRTAREAARARSGNEIAALVERLAGEHAPWLLSTADAPKGAHAQLQVLRRALGGEARTQAEAVVVFEALLDRVEAWNAAHPGGEVAPPGAVAVLNARPPAWNEDSLTLLRNARLAFAAFEAAHLDAVQSHTEDAARLAGLALASALFDSACLARHDLALLARWMADPTGSIHTALDLPPWLDLKRRAPSGRGRAGRRLLRKVSGADGKGGYALRRLFLAPRTLELVALHDAAGGAPGILTTAARTPEKLARLMSRSCGLPANASLRILLKSATLLLQVRDGGPDLTMALLAARRMESFAATPESWSILLEGPSAPASAASAPVNVAQLLTAGDDAPGVAAQPKSDDPAFFQLYAALSTSQRARNDLTTPDAKLTAGALIARLRALPWSDATPACLRLLRDWYLHLLEAEGKAVNSIRRYHSTLGAALCDAAGAARLGGCSAAAFEELYTLILETDQRSALEQSRLRGRLGVLHGFAVGDPRWDFPELPSDLLPRESSVTHVNTTLLGRAEIDEARDILRAGYGLPPDVARAADAAMLAISRGALRIGEATKALWRHYEHVGPGSLDRAEATLFIRPSAFGDNKTPGAYRQIPLMQLMTPAEAEDFEAYLAYRRSLSRKGPLFGVAQPDGAVAPFHTKRLGAVIADCLRRATGLADATTHALRRAAATGLFLAIHEARTSKAGSGAFLERLTGWSPEDRARVAETIAPRSQPRDAWQALARFLGHGGPSTSFESYITAADLAIYESCANAALSGGGTPDILARLDQRHVSLNPPPCSEGTGSRAEIRGTIASPAQALLHALKSIDEGASPDAAARASYLSVDFLTTRLPVARAWRNLTTNRKKDPKPRLQPPERASKLAPAPLGAAPKLAEALSLADRLIARASEDAETTLGWLSTTLHDATMGNAGTRVLTPEALRDWCLFAVTLRDAPRWLIDRIDPPNATSSEKLLWRGARCDGMKAMLRKSATARSITARCRLLAPSATESRRGAPVESWAGCVRFAAHLAAVYLGCEPAPDRACGSHDNGV